MLERTIKLTFKQGDKDFVYEASFPNTGELMAIVSLRNRVSNNAYDNLSVSRDEHSIFVCSLWNTYAFFKVLIPKLFQDIDGEFHNLPVDITAAFCKVFNEDFYPFYNKIINQLSDV